jgi:DNA polymerase-3 subunit epsilon
MIKIPHATAATQRQVAIDVETTGLSPLQGHRVIEIGAVALTNGSIVDEFHSLLFVSQVISKDAHKIHGITNSMLIGQPSPEEVFPRFRSFIENSTLIAHNAKFDMGFLRSEFARLRLPLAHPCICTLELSRNTYPFLRNHRLETVYRHVCGPQSAAMQKHRAIADARMAAAIYTRITQNRVSGK